MSGKASGDVYKYKLPPSWAEVLRAMADVGDQFGRNIYLRDSLLCWMISYSERQVSRIKGELEEAGIIERADPARRASKANPWHINWQRMEPKPRYEEPTRGAPRKLPYLGDNSSRRSGPNSAGSTPGPELIPDKMAGNYQEIHANMSGINSEIGDKMSVNYEEIPDISTTNTGHFHNKYQTFPQQIPAIPTREPRTERINVNRTFKNDSNHAREESSALGDSDSNRIPPSFQLGQPTGAPSPVVPRPPSMYINAVVTDYSRELGDEEHVVQNIAQARRLWAGAAWLDEHQFVDLLHVARKSTQAAKSRHSSDPLRSPMAYFFTLLRQGIAGSLESKTVPAGTPGREQTYLEEERSHESTD